MNNKVRSYITFTRNERTGILCISFIIVVLCVVRGSMGYFMHPDRDTAQEKRLLAAWQQYKADNLLPETDTADTTAILPEIWDEDAAMRALKVNINTADSQLLVGLLGIGTARAGNIVRFRETNGPFVSIEQFQSVFSIPKPVFLLLAPHLTVKDSI